MSIQLNRSYTIFSSCSKHSLSFLIHSYLCLYRTAGTLGWDTDPVTGVQYQRNTQSVLTWHQARKSCQQQGADLLSIVELHEQSYISGTKLDQLPCCCTINSTEHWWHHHAWFDTGLTNILGTSLWIGLNSLDFDSGWQWSNGNPFRYLNWAPG